jgi:hypothetical protein
MNPFTRLFTIAALLLAPAAPLLAQAPVDPSGHWEGAIHVPAYEQAPAKEVIIEIDLAKNSKGVLAGTFGQPAQAVKGLPLSSVAVDGKVITFEIKPGSGGGAFHATLDDAKAMSGMFITNEGGYSIPFSLARTGDARIAAVPKSAPISKQLEGTWNGALDVGGKQMRIVVRMANQPDGTSAGTIVSQDGSGVEIPIAMTQNASKLVIDVPSIAGGFSGVLNEAGTELTGTWTQGPSSLPLTLKRAAATENKK